MRSTKAKKRKTLVFIDFNIYIYIYLWLRCYHMRVTFEVAFQALPPSFHWHCTDEAQKAETVLSAVIYIYIYLINQARGPYWENIGPRS